MKIAITCLALLILYIVLINLFSSYSIVIKNENPISKQNSSNNIIAGASVSAEIEVKRAKLLFIPTHAYLPVLKLYSGYIIVKWEEVRVLEISLLIIFLLMLGVAIDLYLNIKKIL